MNSLLVVIAHMSNSPTALKLYLPYAATYFKMSPKIQPLAMRETALGNTETRDTSRSQVAMCWIITTINLLSLKARYFTEDTMMILSPISEERRMNMS